MSPAQWEIGGYHEIQQERARYRIVDRLALAEALEIDVSRLAAAHTEWIEEAVRAHRQQREAFWTDSVAVGGRQFVETIQCQLGDRGRYRQIDELERVHILREAPEACGRHFGGGNGGNRLESDMIREAQTQRGLQLMQVRPASPPASDWVAGISPRYVVHSRYLTDETAKCAPRCR